MQTPSLRQLRTFLVVVETGTVSAAAQALHLTQPAASQQLRELERLLGVRLLDRASGRMLPTAAGQALLEPARRALTAADDAVAVAAAHRSGSTGRVRLGTGATACIYLLPPVLAAVKQRMPGLEIVIATGNSGDIADRVATGELDVGLVTLPVAAQRGLATARLLTDPLVALIPEASAPAGNSVGPAQLGELPLILYDAGGSTRAIIDSWFRAADLAPRPIMQLDSIEAIKLLVGSGLGASVLPQLSLAAAVPGTVMRRLRPVLVRRLGTVLRRDKVLDRGLRVLLEALSGAVAAAPPQAIPTDHRADTAANLERKTCRRSDTT